MIFEVSTVLLTRFAIVTTADLCDASLRSVVVAPGVSSDPEADRHELLKREQHWEPVGGDRTSMSTEFVIQAHRNYRHEPRSP